MSADSVSGFNSAAEQEELLYLQKLEAQEEADFETLEDDIQGQQVDQSSNATPVDNSSDSTNIVVNPQTLAPSPMNIMGGGASPKISGI